MNRISGGPILRMFKLASAIKKDGWTNILTGLGLKATDKRVNAEIEYLPLRETEVENLYAGDDIAAKVVDVIPRQGLRAWIEYKNLEKDIEKKIDAKLYELNAPKELEKAWRWARLYGGSGILIATDNSNNLDKPLDSNKINEVTSLVTLNRYELTQIEIDKDIKSKNFGNPVKYQLQSSHGGVDTKIIHHSRLLLFYGVDLPVRLKIQNNYWGDSVLSRLYNVLRNFNTGHDSAASILHDFRQGILTIKNLADIIASENDELITQRIQLMNTCRSILNTIVLDEGEKYEQQTASVTGIKDLLDKLDDRLVAATGLPHTIILGDSPSGLGASGDSENRDFYDTISEQQESVLRKPIERLIELILASKKGPTKGNTTIDWSFEFRSLWQMDEKERAQIEKIVAEKDAIYIDRGVVDPDEVAISRFGGEGFSQETIIDLESRKASDA